MHDDVVTFNGTAFMLLRNRAAGCGVIALRSDPVDGRVCYFMLARGKVAMLPTLASLADAVDKLEHEIEVKHGA